MYKIALHQMETKNQTIIKIEIKTTTKTENQTDRQISQTITKIVMAGTTKTVADARM